MMGGVMGGECLYGELNKGIWSQKEGIARRWMGYQDVCICVMLILNHVEIRAQANQQYIKKLPVQQVLIRKKVF
jgi:hypothetical protein